MEDPRSDFHVFTIPLVGGYARDFFARRPPFFIPEGPFIVVHPASAGARAGFPDYAWRDHVWRLRVRVCEPE